MILLTSNSYNKVGFILVWVTMFMAFPFSIAQAFNLPAKIIMTFCISILILIVLLRLKRVIINPILVSIFLLQIITAFVYFFLHKDTGYINFLFQIVVPLVIYVYVNTFLKFQILSNSFIKLMLTMGILSLITFSLCLLFNMSFYSIFENPDGRSGFNFILSFTNVYVDFGFTKFIRPAGFFDEPGTLAYYLLVGIFINDLTLKNKKIRIALIISGVITSSLAFYVIMVVYAIFFIKKDKIFTSSLYFLLAILLICFFYQFLDIAVQDWIYNSTFGRLTSLISPTSTIDNFQADNRSDLVEVAKSAIEDSPLIGQGISYASIKDGKYFGTFMGANILGILGIHGIIGGIIFSLHVFYYVFICFKKRNWFTVPQKLCILFLILMLQRPDYIGGVIPYISVLVLTILSLNYDELSKNIHCHSSLQQSKPY